MYTIRLHGIHRRYPHEFLLECSKPTCALVMLPGHCGLIWQTPTVLLGQISPIRTCLSFWPCAMQIISFLFQPVQCIIRCYVTSSRMLYLSAGSKGLFCPYSSVFSLFFSAGSFGSCFMLSSLSVVVSDCPPWSWSVLLTGVWIDAVSAFFLPWSDALLLMSWLSGLLACGFETLDDWPGTALSAYVRKTAREGTDIQC